MNNEEEKRCPLCAEEMDWTDQQLNPCKCGYEVCVWCWHHIMDMAEKDATEGRCPACRTPYDKDRIVGLETNFQRVTANSSNRKQKLPKAKPKPNEARKDLSNVRVIQRKMAYIIGLPVDLADEEMLQRKDHFGQYGKVTKISLSRTAGGALQQFINDTCSVYITYSKEEEAVTCIQSVHGYVLDGRLLRASFGTAKYCHAWLRNTPCNNPGCLYLHTIGAEEDSFGKDEVAAIHTRNRVEEIVGGTQYVHRRSGSRLPKPVIEQKHNHNASSEEPVYKNNTKVIASVDQNEKNGPIESKHMATFVDIVGRGSSNSNSVQEEEEEEEEEEEILNVEEDTSTISRAPYMNEQKFENSAKSDKIYRCSNSFSNEEIVQHLRRLDNDTLVDNDETSAAVESSIISNILSMDLDGCDDDDDVSAFPQTVADLFDTRDGRQHTHHSRFSFANQHHASRVQNMTPPGFSMANKPPPGFSACMRTTDQAVAANSGNYLRSRPNNHYRSPSLGNLSNSSDDVMDPTMMNNSWASSFSSQCSTSFDDWQHFIQQQSTPPPPPPPPPPATIHHRQESQYSQPQYPSLYTQQQYSQPKFGFGNGYQEGQQKHEVDVDVERFLLPNYGEFMFQLPTSGRVFGM